MKCARAFRPQHTGIIGARVRKPGSATPPTKCPLTKGTFPSSRRFPRVMAMWGKVHVFREELCKWGRRASVKAACCLGPSSAWVPPCGSKVPGPFTWHFTSGHCPWHCRASPFFPAPQTHQSRHTAHEKMLSSTSHQGNAN